MRIGIVTTWFERGAAYVSKQYMRNLIKEGHDVYIYARGGEHMARNDPNWDKPYVTWGLKLKGSYINEKHFFAWIERNRLGAILFNEQPYFKIVAVTKKKYPNVKICAYIDYYTEALIPWYNIYDFVICNTLRHMQALENHPQSFYLRWGTDTEIFKPSNKKEDSSQVTFFHSVGMSTRKGTDVLIRAYIGGELYKRSKLVIHTQIPIERVCGYSKFQLQEYGIEVIEKTVTAPGLYYLGDVYVYPTRLDGLGLTMYEALASGLPVITTNYPPMNEIIDNTVGKLVEVERNYCRRDAYYWPMSICDEKSLSRAIEYYIDHPERLKLEKVNARKRAEEYFDWSTRSDNLSRIFRKAKIRDLDQELFEEIVHYYTKIPLKNNLVQSEFFVKIYKKIRK